MFPTLIACWCPWYLYTHGGLLFGSRGVRRGLVSSRWVRRGVHGDGGFVSERKPSARRGRRRRRTSTQDDSARVRYILLAHERVRKTSLTKKNRKTNVFVFSELRGVQHPQQREHRGSPKRIHEHHLGRIRGEYRGVGQVEDGVHGESHQRVRQPFRSVLRAQRTTDPEQHAEQRDVRRDRVLGTKGEWCLLNRFECGFVNQRRHYIEL